MVASTYLRHIKCSTQTSPEGFFCSRPLCRRVASSFACFWDTAEDGCGASVIHWRTSKASTVDACIEWPIISTSHCDRDREQRLSNCLSQARLCHPTSLPTKRRSVPYLAATKLVHSMASCSLSFILAVATRFANLASAFGAAFVCVLITQPERVCSASSCCISDPVCEGWGGRAPWRSVGPSISRRSVVGGLATASRGLSFACFCLYSVLRLWRRGNIELITTLPVLDCPHSVQHLQPRCLEDKFLLQQTRKKKHCQGQSLQDIVSHRSASARLARRTNCSSTSPPLSCRTPRHARG